MQVTKRGKIYEEVLRIAELFSDISDGCISYVPIGLKSN
jgi:hypothetical protein